jgi:hypothetical protein
LLKGILVDDPLRGTGRSTGLMLKAISEAILNRCNWVRFNDHFVVNDAGLWADVLEMLCAQLGLHYMQIRTRGSEVWIISLMPTRATFESAPEHPTCPRLPSR